MKTTHYYNFDFLKITFTLIVILYHFIREIGFWCKGGYAVELFFIISGFLCFKTFNNSITTPQFIKKKIASFMPLMLVVILFQLIVQPTPIKNILNNIFLVPVWQYDLFISVGWYIIVWFWISVCLFYLTKTLKSEHINLIITSSIFISIALMISYNRWLTWEKISFINAGFLRGIASMGTGYMLAKMLPPPAHIAQLTVK